MRFLVEVGPNGLLILVNGADTEQQAREAAFCQCVLKADIGASPEHIEPRTLTTAALHMTKIRPIHAVVGLKP